MADLIYRLGLYESMTVIPIASFNPGIYYVRLGTPAGNSLLSTLFVKSASGSVAVEYEDSGPGDGTLPGEIINLGGHAVFNTGAVSERIIITRISNKPRIKVTVLGGAVEFGLHISIVSDFPSEAPFLDGDAVDLNKDKGQPLSILDESDGKFYLARGSKGVLSASTAHGFTLDLLRLNASSTWVEHTSVIGAIIEVDVDAQITKRLHISLNNSGVNYSVLAPGSSMEIDVSPAGSIWIRSPNGPTTYSIWLKHAN